MSSQTPRYTCPLSLRSAMACFSSGSKGREEEAAELFFELLISSSSRGREMGEGPREEGSKGRRELFTMVIGQGIYPTRFRPTRFVPTRFTCPTRLFLPNSFIFAQLVSSLKITIFQFESHNTIYHSTPLDELITNLQQISLSTHETKKLWVRKIASII